MAQITWNNVAAPNLGESNNLFAQAIQSLKDAGTGLKDTAKDYQTVVRNKSHAILQDYINSAKTPEELQSEAFNIGFKNLQATLANEYDAVKVNDYRDSAVDKLTKRAGDAVALKRNTLGLTTEQQAADTNDMMNRIFTAPEAERPALIAEAVKLNRFDAKAMLANQTGNASLTQVRNANGLFDHTKQYLYEQPKLANESTAQSTAASKASVVNQAGMLAVAQQNANTAALTAKAEAEAKRAKASQAPDYILKMSNALEEAQAGVTKRALEDSQKIGKDTLKQWHEKVISEDFDADADTLLKTMEKDPKFNKLTEPEKIKIASDIYTDTQGTFGWRSWFGAGKGKQEDIKTKVSEAISKRLSINDEIVNTAIRPAYMEGIRTHAAKQGFKSLYGAAADLGVDEFTIYKLGINTPLVAKAKMLYAGGDKSQPEDVFVEEYVKAAVSGEPLPTGKPANPSSKGTGAKTTQDTANKVAPVSTLSGSLDGGAQWFKPKP